MQGYARADVLVGTEKHWQTYLDLGFMGHFYGVESLYQPAAKAIGKGMDAERLKDGLLKFKEWAYKNNDGFYVAFMSLIAGLPNETYDTLTDQVDWLRKNWQDQFSVMGILQMHLPNNTSKYKEVAKDLGNISLIEKDPESYGYKILGPSNYEKLHSRVVNTNTLDMNSGLYQQGPPAQEEFKAENWTQLIDDGSKKGERGFSVGGDLSEQQGKPIWNRFSQPAINNTTGLEEMQYKPTKQEAHFKTHNSWVSNTGLTVEGINNWMQETALKYNIQEMPTITQGTIASWNQLEYYVDPSVKPKDMMGKGKNSYKVNAASLTQTIHGSSAGQNMSHNGVQFASAANRGANELYYHKKKFLQAYKRNKLNA